MAKHWVLALLHKEGDSYGIHFPDYPGAVSGGVSFDDAVKRGASTLLFHIQGLVDDGEDIPVPAEKDAAIRRAIPEIDNGAMPALIEVDFPGRSVRINISMDEGLLGQVDKAARFAGESRSAFLANAVRDRLRAAS